ncbi:MAG: hypothetical protein BWY68_00083 [bacterium ADurb.Bin400]|nr:MAG: hypothetical protein BWY68_00083 [bacterium ADurb.Bin400]
MERAAILLASIPVFAVLIDLFLSHSVFGKKYRLFVAPGVIIHEMAHAVLCLLTGARIKHIAFFDKNGGSVEHTPPRIPIIGQLLVSLAPLFVGFASIYFLSRYIGMREVSLANLEWSPRSFEQLLVIVQDMVSNIDVRNYINWALIYLMLSIAVTMNPSLQDIRNIAIIIAAAVAGIAGMYRFTEIRPNLDIALPDQAIIVLSTVVILLILSLVLSMIIYALSKLLRIG